MSDPLQPNHEPNDDEAPYPKGKKWVGGTFVCFKLNPDANPEELDAQIDAFCDALGLPEDHGGATGTPDRNDEDEHATEKGEDSLKGGT